MCKLSKFQVAEPTLVPGTTVRKSAYELGKTVLLRSTVDHGRDNHYWLPPVQTRTGADYRIRFLSRMSGGEASVRKGMERSRLRKPARSQNQDARPGDPACVTPAAKSSPPERKHPIPKHTQTREVSWYRVVVEVALHDRLEPWSGLGHGIVHALAKLLLNLLQLGSHALADRRAPHHESP